MILSLLLSHLDVLHGLTCWPWLPCSPPWLKWIFSSCYKPHCSKSWSYRDVAPAFKELSVQKSEKTNIKTRPMTPGAIHSLWWTVDTYVCKQGTLLVIWEKFRLWYIIALQDKDRVASLKHGGWAKVLLTCGSWFKPFIPWSWNVLTLPPHQKDKTLLLWGYAAPVGPTAMENLNGKWSGSCCSNRFQILLITLY